ncbi:MAG: hypothetical protein D6741_09005 [Planctomycetota bacterium]|nr:MAG: hypothetical protein D6741_09005 [Planctomycetota bacterium]
MLLVTTGGVANAVLSLLVVYAAYAFRYHRLPSSLRPGRLYDVLLWISFAAITAVGVVAIVNVLLVGRSR